MVSEIIETLTTHTATATALSARERRRARAMNVIDFVPESVDRGSRGSWQRCDGNHVVVHVDVPCLAKVKEEPRLRRMVLHLVPKGECPRSRER
jgi:hypothetical protein